MTATFDVNNRPPAGAPPMDAQLQNIASAAHLRGAGLAQNGVHVADLAAADLMRALRGAWERSKTNDAHSVQVANIVRGVATRLQQPGPVLISKSLYGICRSYAGLKAPVSKSARGTK